MAKYVISGGKKLKGKITILGNANSIFPCMAAALLINQPITLHNLPQIDDIKVFSEILERLGATIKQQNNSLTIQVKAIKTHVLPADLVRRLRASILLVGPLLARTGQVKFNYPGGDIIGLRSIDPHLEGLRHLGYQFKKVDLYYTGSLKKLRQQKLEHFLNEASVTTTENLILVSVLKPGQTVLKNCASEPHIVDLCNMLHQMGAKIDGIGSSTLSISGVDKLAGTEFTVGHDYIEMGTYAIAAALTRGAIEFENCCLDDLEPIFNPLRKMGLGFKEKDNIIQVHCPKILPIPKLTTNIWPGFPTDIMSPAIVLATQAQGISLLHDWMYESRMFFVDKLISMGANITIADPHRVLVYGPTRLKGRKLDTPDIRAGIALVLAALAADGESVIDHAELIERKYGNVVENLSSLGATIKRIS
ncbi:UDP-N-acetylglucosamine 1-carboxyvinyltransferase [Candidatus Daviesbacteria bacterium]|nr:UDP-N-acetylglucosamine 1-carboxyvinyltransferase [Candidatus Daviesbacteria bacterium]